MKTRTILTIIIALLILSCAGKPLTYEEYNTGDFGPYPYNYEELVKDYFNQRLYDPYSAVYDFFGPPEKAKDGNKYGWKVQMRINAKNRMGGYVGYQLNHFMIKNNDIWLCDGFYTGLMNSRSR